MRERVYLNIFRGTVGAERADREKGVKIAKNGGKGIKIAMIRVLEMGLYVKRVALVKTIRTLLLT